MMWMLLPTLACLVIVITLGWFGLHVLERGVIFVDLALAQVAALGTTYAVFLGHDPDGGTAFAMALTFTLIGAAAFSAARIFEERVPQEAIIGIAYAVSAASGILMIHFADDPHGGEKLEHLLVGNIVWVQPHELWVLAGVCASVGVVHFLCRRAFLAVTFRSPDVRRVAAWDLLFYSTFGLALTAIVSVSGVLLVFSYLVIPAVVARLLVSGVVPRLLVAWALGIVVSVAGVSVSYSHPTGPVIVAMFGAALVVTLVGWAITHADHKGRAVAQCLAAFGAVGGVLAAFTGVPVAPEAHDHEHVEAAEAPSPVDADGLLSEDPMVRETAAREADGKPERSEALAAAMAKESDPGVKLVMAVALAHAGDVRSLAGLAAIAASETPYFRREADGRLRDLAKGDSPPFDPMTGPDSAGAWAAWAATQTAPPAGMAEMAMP